MCILLCPDRNTVFPTGTLVRDYHVRLYLFKDITPAHGYVWPGDVHEAPDDRLAGIVDGVVLQQALVPHFLPESGFTSKNEDIPCMIWQKAKRWVHGQNTLSWKFPY